MHTFAVAPVEPCRHLYRPYSPAAEVLRAGYDARVSACNAPKLVDPSMFATRTMHPMLATVMHAYAVHYPLVFSPDDVWLCIVQGLAAHVNEHAETLRGRFVRHEGKKEIVVAESWLGDGTAEDWQRHIGTFADRVAEDIGKRRELLVAGFSTTGPVEKVVFEISLLDAVQRYFNYRSDTICGIPFVTLLGTPDDWRSLRRRAEMLTEFGLADWARVLLPVLDRFVAASEGQVDVDFWRSIYKLHDICGDPVISGWINVLFWTKWSPILPIDALLRLPERHVVAGKHAHSYPTGLSRAPFTRCSLDRKVAMEFVGGFVGVAQDPATAALRPSMGWLVREARADADGVASQEVAQSDATTHFDLGVAYAEMGLHANAIDEFTTAARNPALACVALMKKGEAHLANGNRGEASVALTHALEAGPTPEQESAIRKALSDLS